MEHRARLLALWAGQPSPAPSALGAWRQEAERLLQEEERLLAEARRRGVTAPDGEVAEKVAASLAQLGALYGPGDAGRSALAKAGLKESDIAAWAQRQVVLEELYRALDRGSAIAEGELRAFYDQHPERFTMPPAAHIRLLVASRRSAAVEGLSALAAGRSPSGLRDLGYVAADGAGMPSEPELALAIRSALAAGRRTFGPVPTAAGWAAGVVDDLRPAEEIPFPRVADQIRSYLEDVGRQRAFERLMGGVNGGIGTRTRPYTSMGFL